MSDLTYEQELAKLEESEKECERLQNEIKKIQEKKVNLNELEIPPSLENLRSENSKLKYQKQILKKSIEEEKKKKPEYAPELINLISSLFSCSIKSTFPHLISHDVIITKSTNEKFGDYQCNSAMALSKQLPEKGNPREIANKIVSNIPKNNIIEKLEVAGPGFINVFLNAEFISSLISAIFKNGVLPPFVARKHKVVLDMSSPNIAKEMHVGHLRSTIIGESIARLHSFLGHVVLKLNHLGDWGTQFGMLITNLRDQFPDFKTKCPPLGDLQTFYKQSKQRFDTEEDFKKRAYEAVVSLQGYEGETTQAWKLICQASEKEFSSIYKRLGIKNLVSRGESFYQKMMEEVVMEMEEKGLLKDDEGRKISWPEGHQVPLTVVKSDGGFTYATSDLAALRHRLKIEKADEILYVIDSGQTLHLEAVYASGRDAGWYDPMETRVIHVGFGVVLGEDKKKFKTRSGDTIRLVDLLDEGLKRAEAKLKEKERDKVLTEEEFKKARESVAYGCIKYADLSHCRTNDYVFSFDKMLDDKGNTAVYLLYAFMRIQSINRQINIKNDDLYPHLPPSLSHPKELKLAKSVARFPEVVTKCTKDLLLHNLCDYLYELCTFFTEFYDQCYVVEKNEKNELVKINYNRLILLQVVAMVIEVGLDILGIDTVGKL